MTRRYTYATTISWGGDVPTAEADVEVSYTVAWGSPETGRFGPPENYDPGCGSEVEDIRLELVNGRARPWGMYSGYVADEDAEFEADVVEKLEGSERHLEAMISEAAEIAEADDADARERMWADRLEGLGLDQ